MEKKKATAKQLQNKIKNAILHIDYTKNTKQIYFDDRGLRISVNEDWACIGGGNYTCVFNIFTPSGISIQYTFLKRFLEIALQNADKFTTNDEKGEVFRSYQTFIKSMEKEYENGKDKENDYLWVWYVDKWIYNYECQFASLGEEEWQSFATFEKFIHNVACNHVIFSEKVEDMTNHQYVTNVIEKMKDYMDGIKESIIFKKQTDEEKQKEEISALQQVLQDKIIGEQNNGNEQ